MMTHNEDSDQTPVSWRAEAATGATTKYPADAAASADPANDAFARPVGTQHSVVKSRHLTDGPVHTATESGGSELSADNRKSDPERGREANTYGWCH